MKNILVDIGNTLMKSALADGNEISSHKNWDDLSSLRDYIIEKSPQIVFISSVTKRHHDLIKELPANQKIKIFDKQTPLPIKVHYTTKDTLGLDRVAAVMGAYALYPKANNLVIDIGTCITYDFLDDQGVYHGGAISPGINIRLKSLNNYTSKLPLVDISHLSMLPELTGNSSVNSILSGVLNGILFEIEGFISTYNRQYKSINTIITGGDCFRFESTIKAHIFVAPKLILIGLNRILLDNEQN